MRDNFLDFSNDKSSSYEPIPPGVYAATIDEAEMKDTKDGEGKYIKTTFRIIEGTQEGRKLFHNFNILNKNDKAMEIGRGQLKSYMESAGMKTTKLESPLDLVGFKVLIKTKIKTSEDYGDKAEISYFKPYSPTGTSKEVVSNLSPF